MTVNRFRGALLGLGALALFASACGQPLDQNLPQNEALENAPEGILFLDEDTAPDFAIQALTAAEQTTFLNTVNATRTKGTKCGGVSYPAAPALATNARLVTAAEAHAADMANNNYFSHTGRDGSNPGTRITRAGYNWSTYGENIAAGQSSISTAVSGWYASTGHCQNFMNKGVTQVGFGKATNASSTYKTYWVAVLAKPR